MRGTPSIQNKSIVIEDPVDLCVEVDQQSHVNLLHIFYDGGDGGAGRN